MSSKPALCRPCVALNERIRAIRGPPIAADRGSTPEQDPAAQNTPATQPAPPAETPTPGPSRHIPAPKPTSTTGRRPRAAAPQTQVVTRDVSGSPLEGVTLAISESWTAGSDNQRLGHRHADAAGRPGSLQHPGRAGRGCRDRTQTRRDHRIVAFCNWGRARACRQYRHGRDPVLIGEGGPEPVEFADRCRRTLQRGRGGRR